MKDKLRSVDYRTVYDSERRNRKNVRIVVKLLVMTGVNSAIKMFRPSNLYVSGRTREWMSVSK